MIFHSFCFSAQTLQIRSEHTDKIPFGFRQIIAMVPLTGKATSTTKVSRNSVDPIKVLLLVKPILSLTFS